MPMPSKSKFTLAASFAGRLQRLFLAVAVGGSILAIGPHSAKAQSAGSGTTSRNYCGTAMVEELARRIGGRVGTVNGNGSTEFVAPEIPVGETLSVRCGDAPETYGTYGGHNWAPAFLNAFLAIAEGSMGRPQPELLNAMAQCRRLAFRPFNRNTGLGFSKADGSGSAEVKTRRFTVECNFESDPIYSRYSFKSPTSRN
jgi:hypothetical protein